MKKKKKIYTKSHYCGTAKHQRQDILKSEGKSWLSYFLKKTFRVLSDLESNASCAERTV